MAGLLVTAACGGGGEAGEDGREQVTTVGLEEAFSSAAEATSYRIEQYTGQTISSEILGDSTTVIDEENPTVVGEVTPDATHLQVDLSAVLGPLLGEGAADIGFEIWTDPERMVLDTRDYAAVKEGNPEAELGPFEPGVSFVDLGAIKAEASDLATMAAGQGAVDLAQLAVDIPDVLEGVEFDGTAFTGTASYADFLMAMGSDVEQIARSAAGALALNLGIEPDILTDFYVDFYESTDGDVTVEVGNDDLVQSVRFDVELSGVFSSMVSESDPLGLDVPADEIDEVRDAFEETEWTFETLIEFEVVDGLTVESAPDTTDDRTEEWVTFLEESGF